MSENDKPPTLQQLQTALVAACVKLDAAQKAWEKCRDATDAAFRDVLAARKEKEAAMQAIVAWS